MKEVCVDNSNFDFLNWMLTNITMNGFSIFFNGFLKIYLKSKIVDQNEMVQSKNHRYFLRLVSYLSRLHPK